MVTQNPQIRFTYEDYCQLSEDKRYELIDGEFYEMAPAPSSIHQRIVLKLARLLSDLVEQLGLGEVFISPFDVILSDNDVVQPDLFFVSRERLHLISIRGCEGAPDLVVEVMSPSTSRRDWELKRRLYAAYGVREYWIIDPAAGSIEVLVLSNGGYVSQGIVAGERALVSPILPGFTFPVAGIFPTD